MKKTAIRIHSVLLALILCVSLFTVMAVPASASYLSGDWEKVKLNDMTVYAFAFDTPVKKCTSFTLEIDVSMKANAYCRDWQVWVRNNGSYTKLTTLYLPDGNGFASKTIRFSSPTNFDGVAVTPKKRGNFSWSMYIDVKDVECSSASSSTSSAGSSSDSITNAVPGEWESVRIKDGDRSYRVYALEFDNPLRRVKSFTIYMDVNMLHNTSCKEWKVWGGVDGSYTKLDTIYLPNGRGSTSQTFYFSNARTFDSIAITPKKDGSFSWEMDFIVYDVTY